MREYANGRINGTKLAIELYGGAKQEMKPALGSHA